MKRYILTVLLLIPCVSFGAPSVRVLGTQNAGVKSVAEKTTTTTAKVNQVAPVRTGTVKTKNNGVTGVLTARGARFPVITTAKVYNSVSQPSGSSAAGNSSSKTDVSDATVKRIIDSVTDKVQADIQNEYYSKSEVDNKIAELNSMIANLNDFDDPRFDAIRVYDPKEKRNGQSAPDEYIYVWIEN